MNEQKAFDTINGMLENTDLPLRITSVADIEDFLINDHNRRFEQYAEIGRIYDNIRKRPQIDRYPEPSIGKKEEEHKSAFNADDPYEF